MCYGYAYNQNNDLPTSVTAFNNGTPLASVQYGYNTKKQLSSITRNGFGYNFLYDVWGNMTNVKIGSRTLSSKSYHPFDGTLRFFSYGNGWGTSYSYDKLGRLIGTSSLNMSNGTAYGSTSYGYNKLGQLTEYYDSLTGVTQRYDYDSIGRLTSSLNSDGSLDVGYDYNDKGQLFTCTYVIPETGSMTNRYYYNSDGYLTTELTPMSTNTYTVDKFGRITQRQVTDYEPGSTAQTTAYTYLAGVGGTDATTTLVSSETISNYGSISYNYDTVGNVEYLSVNRGGSTKSIGYAYDRLGQLKTEHNELNNQTVEYTYDAGGNITSKTTYNGVWGQKDTSSAVTDTYTYGDSEWKDLLTAYNGQTITYDAIGNPLTYRRGEIMTWKDGRRLTNFYLPSDGANGAVSFNYDSNGMRISKSGPRVGAYGNSFSVNYFYDGATLVYERRFNPWPDAAGTTVMIIRYIYDANGIQGFYVKTGTTTTRYYYVKNMLGDIIGITDDDGVLVAQYTYNAYGKIMSILDGSGNDVSSDRTHIANINPFRYKGYYYDVETGFYYVSSRYYDPETGRFINADSQLNQDDVLGYNMFAYCNNNPVVYSDPTGHNPTLRRGSSGDWVSKLQSLLNQNGANLDVDGMFGPLTQQAVRNYQSVNGLEVDGICGPQTWGSLLQSKEKVISKNTLYRCINASNTYDFEIFVEIESVNGKWNRIISCYAQVSSKSIVIDYILVKKNISARFNNDKSQIIVDGKLSTRLILSLPLLPDFWYLPLFEGPTHEISVRFYQ